MSRLYFDIDTNLKPTDSEHPTPEIEYIAFESSDGHKHISLSCEGTCDWGVDKNGVLSGRWKDVEICIEDTDGNRICEWRSMKENDLGQLTDCTPYEVGLYMTDTPYSDDFVAELKNLGIDIEYGGEVVSIQTDTVGVIAY